MSSRTNIEWCDSTFNPWIGCTSISPGCDHCYAEALMDMRIGRVKWGVGNPRSRTSAANWMMPVRWNAEEFVHCVACQWRGALRDFRRVDPTGFEHSMCPTCNGVDYAPARRRVFCASLGDVFDNEVDPRWRDDLFDLIISTPSLDWQLLTKRIGNVPSMVHSSGVLGGRGLPPNVWLGATVVNQEEADRDIPKLVGMSAGVRFLSIEPMLGPIDLRLMRRAPLWAADGASAICFSSERLGLNWVICGGESGRNARPMHQVWARSLRDQCAAADLPFLFKQWGEWGPAEQHENLSTAIQPGVISFSGDFSPGFHRDRPSDDALIVRVGKKAAGRMLDGREWNEFPA